MANYQDVQNRINELNKNGRVFELLRGEFDEIGKEFKYWDTQLIEGGYVSQAKISSRYVLKVVGTDEESISLYSTENIPLSEMTGDEMAECNRYLDEVEFLIKSKEIQWKRSCKKLLKAVDEKFGLFKPNKTGGEK